MTTKTKLTRAPSTSPPLRPTLGPGVVRWIERNLKHGEGDYFGQPVRLEPFQKRHFWRLYEIDEVTGRRLVRVALLGVGKGGGKTPIAAMVGAAELAGPTVPHWDGNRRVGEGGDQR